MQHYDADSDDESTPIIALQPLNRQKVEQVNKHRKLVQAVYGLNYVWGVTCLIVIVALSAYILTINIVGLDSYFPFFVIGCGEMVTFVMLYHIIQLLMKALTNRDQKGNGVSDLLVSNESKIPLALFILKLIVYFTFVHVLMIVSEVLLCLSIFNISSWVFTLIPLFILCIQVLFVSIFTRLNHVLLTISAVLMLSFGVLLMLEEWSYIDYTWFVVLSPLILLVSLWVLVLCYIFYMQQVGTIRLKSGQYQSFYLYMCGFVLLVVDLLYWQFNIEYFEDNFTIPLCMLVISLIFLASASSIDFFRYLDHHIRKMGSAVPIPLRQNSKGQWIVHTAKNHRDYFILGQLEPGSYFDDDDDNDNPSTFSLIMSLFSFSRKERKRGPLGVGGRRDTSYSESSVSSEEDGIHNHRTIPAPYD